MSEALDSPEGHSEGGIENLAVSQRDKARSTLQGPWGQTGTGPPPCSQHHWEQGGGQARRERNIMGEGCGVVGLWPLEETGLGGGVGERGGGSRGQPLIFGLLQLFAHINLTIKISTGKKKKERKKRVGSGHVLTHANFREFITLEIVHQVVGAAFF